MRRTIVIGGGSWGSALAVALRSGGGEATVLVRDEDSVRMLATGRCRQLGHLAAVDPIDASTDPTILAEAGLILIVVPVSATAAALEMVGRHNDTNAPVVLCAKGMAMRAKGAVLMPELAGTMLPAHPAVILSGPNLADEVMRGLPAAAAAATDQQAVALVQQAFAASQIRVYASGDPLGVAIGGTIKNVIAIAAGCAIGLGLGDNARAAIITRGLAGMARFAAARAHPKTHLRSVGGRRPGAVMRRATFAQHDLWACARSRRGAREAADGGAPHGGGAGGARPQDGNRASHHRRRRPGGE